MPYLNKAINYLIAPLHRLGLAPGLPAELKTYTKGTKCLKLCYIADKYLLIFEDTLSEDFKNKWLHPSQNRDLEFDLAVSRFKKIWTHFKIRMISYRWLMTRDNFAPFDKKMALAAFISPNRGGKSDCIVSV